MRRGQKTQSNDVSMPLFQSNHLKRIGLVAAAAVLPCVILIGTGFWKEFRIDEIFARHRALEEAQLIAAKIDMHLGALENLLSNLSAAVSKSPSDVNANDALLRRAKSELPRFIANIFVLSLNGQNIGNAVGHHASAGDRDYFQRAVAGAPLVVGAPIRSRSNLGWVIPVACPVKNSAGEIQAVLTVATFLDGFLEIIGINKLPMDSIVRIVTDDEIELTSILNAPMENGNDRVRLGNAEHRIRLDEGSERVALHDNAARIV